MLAVVSSSPFTHAPERNEQLAASRTIHIDPNPANDLVRLNFYSEESGNAIIKVFDLAQQLRFQTNALVNSGNNDDMLKLPILSAGEYILQYEDEWRLFERQKL